WSRRVQEMCPVVVHEGGQATRGPVPLPRAEGSLDEDARAVADVAIDRRGEELGQPKRAQHVVHGGRKVGTRVDQRAIEIEDEVLVSAADARTPHTANDEPQPQVWRAPGVANLNPPPWRRWTKSISVPARLGPPVVSTTTRRPSYWTTWLPACTP